MTRVRGFVRKADLESLWLITFADLMVQLMAFFAVIYSFSVQDTHRLKAVLKSMRQELGVEKADGAEAPKTDGEGILPGNTGIDPNRAADLEKLLSDMKATDGPDVGTRMRIVSFRGGILFPEGSAAVDPSFQPMLQRISELVAHYPGFTLICEGHAAPGEHGGGHDALDLSGVRAQSVVRYLVQHGVDPRIVAAEAHGDSQVDGDPSSPEGRALQRRVRFRFQRVAER
nr:flagellar motor protein MotB [uncultured Holophaga sp.]